jgi:hypothetical protein
MTDLTIDRLGNVNNTGDEKALFLKDASAEIIAAYDETNVMDALHFTRTIDSGKSAGFPMTGKISAGYHVPGKQLLGSQTLAKNEMIINVDDLLVSDVTIANIDEAMSHIDYRREYTRQIGAALARAKDQRLLQTAVLAARSNAIVSGMPGGSVITSASIKTDGVALAAAISAAAVAMDEKDVPEDGRSVILKPAQTHLLSQTPDVMNKDSGGWGSFSNGKTGEIDNVSVMKSNNVPQSVIAGATGDNNTYDGDFSNTVGVVMRRNAVGTVKLLDLVVEMTGNDFAVMYQGTLVVGKYLQGHGILNAAEAVELAIA